MSSVTNLIWLTPAKFEREWLLSLLGPVNERDGNTNEMYENEPVFIMNSVVKEYEAYFARYEAARISYAVIHLSDEYYQESYQFYEHEMCRFVIRNYFHPVLARMPKVKTIGLGWRDGFAKEPVPIVPWSERPITVSFAGNVHHELREQFISAFRPVQPNAFYLTRNGFNSANGLPLPEYKALMANSKYVLCPIGHWNIDCFRIYEALEAGAVPIAYSITRAQPWFYWKALFQTDFIPFIHEANARECYEALKQRQKNPETEEMEAKRTHLFWEDAKRRWGVISACSC